MEWGIIAKTIFIIPFAIWAYHRGWYDWVLPNVLKRHKRSGKWELVGKIQNGHAQLANIPNDVIDELKKMQAQHSWSEVADRRECFLMRHGDLEYMFLPVAAGAHVDTLIHRRHAEK